MQEFFCDRRIKCKINDKAEETIVFKRASKQTHNILTEGYLYKGLLQDDTKIATGDVITDPNMNTYMVTVRRDSFYSKNAQLQKTNAVVTLARLKTDYNDIDVIGTTQEIIGENVHAFCKEIDPRMRMFDIGLLPKTILTVLLTKQDIQVLDRLIFGGKNYQIDCIDTKKYEGLLYIQCSCDERQD